MKRFIPVALLLAVSLSACAAGRAASPRATLPPDSVELLRRAIAHARPAYPTQAEALRAGEYERAAADLPQTEVSRQVPPPPTADIAAQDHRFGIQVAAFRDAASAELSAADARRNLPDLTVSVRADAEWFRVVVGGWPDLSGAERVLPMVRQLYPSAWVRALSIP